MSASTTTHSPSGNRIVLDALLAAPDRTLNNVQLGSIPGVQAFRSRISDLRRLGFLIPEAIRVTQGRYAYTLAGARYNSDAAEMAPGLPCIALLDSLDAESEAIARVKLNPEKYASSGGTNGTPDTSRALATARARAVDAEAQIEAARHDLAEALREQPGESTLSELVAGVIAALEAARRPRARRVNPDRGPNGPALMRKVLEDAGQPIHSKIIAERVMANGGDKVYHGLTPDATMAAQLATSNKQGGDFVKVSPGCFGLREWDAARLELEPLREWGADNLEIRS